MKNEFERDEEDSFKRAEIAQEQVGKLLALNDVTPEDVVNTASSLKIQRTPKAPDLKMDPEKINITISELKDRMERNSLDKELGRKMIEDLKVQRAISLDRAPSFAEQVRTAPSRVVETVSNVGFPGTRLTTLGKALIGVNGIAATSAVFSSLNHFSAGDTNGGFLFLGLVGFNSAIGVFNFITQRR